jgi:hypothetical protein
MPPLTRGERFDVMRVSEHEALREAAQAVVDAGPGMMRPLFAAIHRLADVLSSADHPPEVDLPTPEDFRVLARPSQADGAPGDYNYRSARGALPRGDAPRAEDRVRAQRDAW